MIAPFLNVCALPLGFVSHSAIMKCEKCHSVTNAIPQYTIFQVSNDSTTPEPPRLPLPDLLTDVNLLPFPSNRLSDSTKDRLTRLGSPIHCPPSMNSVTKDIGKKLRKIADSFALEGDHQKISRQGFIWSNKSGKKYFKIVSFGIFGCLILLYLR